MNYVISILPVACFPDGSGIPSIPVKNCIGGLPANLGDLNGDGSDEIGLSPQWFTSCWAPHYAWRFRDGRWDYAVPPFSTHCAQFEEFSDPPVWRDPAGKGYAMTRYMVIGDTTFEIRTKRVRLQ